MPRAFCIADPHSRPATGDTTMKITLPRAPIRNPLVRLSHLRHAGVHGPSAGAKRQRSARELRRELERMSHKERSPTP